MALKVKQPPLLYTGVQNPEKLGLLPLFLAPTESLSLIPISLIPPLSYPLHQPAWANGNVPFLGLDVTLASQHTSLCQPSHPSSSHRCALWHAFVTIWILYLNEPLLDACGT